MMPLRTHQREPANLTIIQSDSVGQRRSGTVISAVLYFVLWSYAAVAISSSVAAPVDKFDDAIPLLHAMLIQQGYTPNLDFYSFYPPLNLYLNAAAFKLLGRTVIAARAIADFLYVIVLMLVTCLFRSRFRSYGPLVPAAVLFVATSIGGAMVLPVWPGFAISLAAVLVYLCSEGVGRYRIWLVGLSGLLAAFGILSRINFGCYAVMVIGLDFVRRWWLDGNQADRVRLRKELTTVAAFTIPFVTCCLGLCMWIYGRHIDIALSQFIVTAQRLMAVRGFIKLRFEPNLACVVALPFFWFFVRVLKGSEDFIIRQFLPLAFGIGVLLFALAGAAHPMTAVLVTILEVALVVFLHVFIRRLEASEFSFLVFFCGVLHYYLSRADGSHWRLLPVAGALLVPFFFMSSDDPDKRRFERSASTGTALAVMIIGSFVFVAAPSFRPGFTAVPNGLALMANFIHNPHSTDSDRVLAGAAPPAWKSVYPDRDELSALRYLREKTNSSTPLFVGVRDHSVLFWNDLRIYWLAQRPIAVRTFQLETKVATEEAFQREIAADLERDKRTWVILDSAKDGDDEFSRAHYKGSELLDNYIEQNFKEEAKFGHYVILTRAGD